MSTVMHDVLQPGKDDHFQCVVKRDKTKSTYTLSLGFGSPPVTEGKFLLVARKVRRATSIEYIISSDDAFDAIMSNGSGANVVGKLRSNILSKSFTIYGDQLLSLHNGEFLSNGGRSMSSTEDVPGVVQARNVKIGQVDCDLERDYDPVIWTGSRPRGFPRRTRCTLYTIPASTIDDKGFARSAPTEFPAPRVNSNGSFRSLGLLRCLQSKSAGSASRVADVQSLRSELPLVLKSRAPRWSAQRRYWCLNFGGRVTVRSVKNFQLVAATQPNQTRSETSGHDKVLLQFGKIGKDVFTMDYRYPLSALQAFAICLTNFDKKCYL